MRCGRHCSDPRQWRKEVRLTEESFDNLEAPEAGGLFLGDYVGLTATKRHLLAFFPQSFPDDPASGFFRSAGTHPLGVGDLVGSAK